MISRIGNSFTNNVLMMGCHLQVIGTWANRSMVMISHHPKDFGMLG